LSLLQRKPDEWRRQHATPSSSGATACSAKNIRLKSTAPSEGTVPTNEHDDREEEAPGKSSPAKERKKRKRSTAADEIDVLFDDVIGWKIVRGELAVDPAPVPAFLKSKTKAKEGERQSEERVGVHPDLGAVVDAIRVGPSVEGKKGESDGLCRSTTIVSLCLLL